MSGLPFNLHSLLPQRGPIDAFCNASSEPEAFSAAFIWATVFFAVIVFLWVVYQWAAIWKQTRLILDSLADVTPENALDRRERLRRHGGALWLEFDASLVEEPAPLTGALRLHRTVDAAYVFNERTLARQLIQSRLIMATPGLLTAVGLLGAFAGLALGLSGLDLTSGHIEQGISNLIKGISIKFCTSIWGIFCSIIFNVLEKLVEAGVLTRIHQVQLRVDGLFPRFIPETILARLQASSGESEKILRGLAGAIAGEIHTALAQTSQLTSSAIGEAMKPAMETFARATQQMTADLTLGSTQGMSEGIAVASRRMEETFERIGDRYNHQFTESSQRLTAAFERLQTPIAQLSDALRHRDAMLADAIGRLDAHAGLATTLAGAASTMQSAADSLGMLRNSWELAASRYEAAAAAQEHSAAVNERAALRLESIANDLHEFRQGIEAASRVVGSFGAPMQNLQQVLSSLPEQVRSVESERRDGDAERENIMRQITGDLAETIRRAVEQLSGHAQVAESLRSAAGQMADSTRSLESFSAHIRDAAGKQEKAASAAENAAVSNARAVGALESLPGQMTTASGGLTQAADAIRQTARTAAQGYTQVAEQQHRFVQDLADGLGQFAVKIREVLQVYGEDVQAQTRDRIHEFAEGTTGILNQLANLESELKGDLETVETVASRIREDALR